MLALTVAKAGQETVPASRVFEPLGFLTDPVPNEDGKQVMLVMWIRSVVALLRYCRKHTLV